MRLKRVVLGSISIAMLTPAALAQTPETAPNNPGAAPGQAADAPQPQTDADAASAEPNPDEEYVEEIVVVGLQRSMQKAQSVKRNSDQIVDTVVAQDIGKLPDVTVSETAARIPGVQVARERGEAAGQVLVRGLPDVTTTYNGREIFTAETRSVALADFPSGGIASLDVYKTTTADLIEGGIAGLIDVRARRPFDFEGLEISGAARGSYANQSGMFDPNANILATNRWRTGVGELGALLNFSYNRLNYLDSARWNSGNIATGRTATGEQFLYPETVGIFYGAGQRERPSVNGAVQWRPASGLELYAEGLWQGYRDSVSDRRFQLGLRSGGSQFTNLTLRPGTTDQAQSLTVENYSRPFMIQGATRRETDTYQLAVGGSYEAGPVRLTADVARTDSRFDMSIYSFDQELASAPAVNVNFDVPRGPGGMEFSFQDFDLNNSDNYRYLGFFDRSYVAAGDDWQARTDLDWNTGFSFVPKVEAGVRFTTRDAYQENGERFGPAAGGTPQSAAPVDLHVFRGGFRGSDIQGTRTWIVPTYESIRRNVEQLRELQNFTPGAPERLRSFEADEQSFAGYAQARYAFQVGSVPVDGILGLRAVRTNTRVTSNTLANGAINRQTDSGNYTDLLPTATARIRFIPDLQLRLSATQTRTRPGFEQMRPILLGPPPACLSEPEPAPSCQVTGSGGNPDLDPVRSTNYDATLEYYFLQTGMASLALFHRDFNGFITNLQVTRDSPVYGPRRLLLNIPVNGGKGSLQGFEATLGSFFDFLPGWLSGFGAQANLTYLNDEQAFPTGVELELGEKGRIPNVSNWSYNLVAMYERQEFSARLAYNYRSRWITSYVQNPEGGGFTGEYVDGVSRLDFSASYAPWQNKPWENITFTFDASNILGNPFRDFRKFTPEGATYPRDVRYEESVYALGVRVRI
jgi:TonB-dependent receptor